MKREKWSLGPDVDIQILRESPRKNKYRRIVREQEQSISTKQSVELPSPLAQLLFESQSPWQRCRGVEPGHPVLGSYPGTVVQSLSNT